MAKGMRPLRLTSSVQNVDPVPFDRPSDIMKGTNRALKLRTPKIPAATKFKGLPKPKKGF